EETIEIESSEASEKIPQLEKQDKELLDTVISFNEEELDKIKEKADEAIKVNEDLKKALNEEEENFKEAKEMFEKSEKQIKKLEKDLIKIIIIFNEEILDKKKEKADEAIKVNEN